MVTEGPSLFALIPVAMMLVGIVSILRTRHARKHGERVEDITTQTRQAAAAESERRMASYLASRDQAG
jgi:hypothetical protein